MEVTLDIGKHIFSEIETIAKIGKIGFDVFALKMLDLGLRVYQSSKEDLPSISQESLLEDILKKCLKTNLLLEEAMGHLFDKERSTLKVYDHHTAIKIIDSSVDAIIKNTKDKKHV